MFLRNRKSYLNQIVAKLNAERDDSKTLMDNPSKPFTQAIETDVDQRIFAKEV